MTSLASCFAFFDVDDTLIRIKSMFDFYRFWALEYHRDPLILERFDAHFSKMREAGAPREELNRSYYRFFSGVHPAELEEAGSAWARPRLSAPQSLFVPAAVCELTRLKSDGVPPVFVSGSFKAVLAPLGQHLGVSHILATTMVTGPDGHFTGEISEPQTIGEGKAVAIRSFLDHHDADAEQCFAFGDDLSDLPMLKAVGKPCAVGQDTSLARQAEIEKWRILPTAIDKFSAARPL